MHFSTTYDYHATIYSDDGYVQDNGWKWNLWGVDGHNYGMCFAYDTHDMDCVYPGTNHHFYLSRKFRCVPNDHAITAKWINQVHMDEGGETMGHKYHRKRSVSNVTGIAWKG